MKMPLLLPPAPDFSFEALAMDRGLAPVAGVDEAGRGPLAGPVVAAAVILDPAAIPGGLNDSKALKEHQREALFEVIMGQALAVAVSSVPAAMIDAINIRQATLRAMRQALAGLALRPRHVLVDGRDVPVLPAGVSGEAVIKGDARSQSIAAASIVAKVMRDRMMRRVVVFHAAYGFGIHKGYGTLAHRQAMAAHGLSPLHRKSFGLARMMSETQVKQES